MPKYSKSAKSRPLVEYTAATWTKTDSWTADNATQEWKFEPGAETGATQAIHIVGGYVKLHCGGVSDADYPIAYRYMLLRTVGGGTVPDGWTAGDLETMWKRKDLMRYGTVVAPERNNCGPIYINLPKKTIGEGDEIRLFLNPHTTINADAFLQVVAKVYYRPV